MPITLTSETAACRIAGTSPTDHNRSREERARESLERFTILLEQSPIIPAVRSPENLNAGSQCPGKIVYFLFGDPENSGDMMRVIAAAGKVPILNIDLAAGL